ncbi:MAG: hypothetical protein ACLRT4_18200 [Thomasclavelia sp.]
MIKADNLDEYVSIKVLINYCQNQEKCIDCMFKNVCSCMPMNPEDIEACYEQKKEIKDYNEKQP